MSCSHVSVELLVTKLVAGEMKVSFLHVTFVRIGLVTMHLVKSLGVCVGRGLCFLFLLQSFHRSFPLFRWLRNR